LCDVRHGDSDELLYLAGQCAIRKDPLAESLEGPLQFQAPIRAV
jgi:hypothetical protein